MIEPNVLIRGKHQVAGCVHVRPTWQQRARNFVSTSGVCLCCGLGWDVVPYHSTPFGGRGSAPFPLCEVCWAAMTPDERLPFYGVLMAEWVRQGTDKTEVEFDEIRAAVLAGL